MRWKEPPAEASSAAINSAVPDREEPNTIASGLTSYVQCYLSKWQYVKPELIGSDLAAMGLPRGPLYREILAAIRRKRLDGKITEQDEESAYIQTYLP